MIATFFRGKTTEFLDSLGSQNGTNVEEDNKQIFNTLHKDKTLFLGFNPGFGSGYEALVESWAMDLVKLLDLRYPVFFTQANDFSDLKGETRVMEVLFESKIKMILAAEQNPFRAMTHYSDESVSAKSDHSVWCCANTHIYGW